MFRYNTIKYNDVANAPGITVSIYLQGCPHRCLSCHNPETWSFNGGQEFTNETLNNIKEALMANGIQRSLSILGGEPLCEENLFLTLLITKEIKETYPDIKIYLWTGYLLEDLLNRTDPKTIQILDNLDYLIDGPFILAERDITLPMRGSHNQRIFKKENGEFIEIKE